MFEVDGKQLTLQEVQAAADQNQLTLDEYKQKFNVKDLNDPGSRHISKEDFEQYSGDKVEENLVKTLNVFNNFFNNSSIINSLLNTGMIIEIFIFF